MVYGPFEGCGIAGDAGASALEKSVCPHLWQYTSNVKEPNFAAINFTALIAAAGRYRINVVKALVGWNWSIFNYKLPDPEQIAIHTVMEVAHSKVVTVLCRLGADLNASQEDLDKALELLWSIKI